MISLKKIQIAVVDDDILQQRFMDTLLQATAKELALNIQIHFFDSGEAFLFSLEDLPELEIAFLDIQMKGLNGLKAAQKVRESNQTVTLIFVTAFAEYALESYGVNALDYALKPITQEKMTQVFKRYLGQRPQEMKYLLVEHQGYPHKLNLQDIIYIEAAKHQTVLTLSNEEALTLNMSLSKIQEAVDERFISSHRSYLVNLSHVDQLTKQSLRLSNGHQVPISRRLDKKVQEAFINYYKKDVFHE